MQPPINSPPAPSIGYTSGISDHSISSSIEADTGPFVPPPMMPIGDSRGIDPNSERGPLGLLGVVFFVIFLVVMIIMVSSAGIGDSSFGVLFIFVIVLMIIFAVARFAIVNASPPPEPVQTQSPPVTREVRVETVRETVKVRCRYCGTLNFETDTKCASCGGNL